MFLVLVRTRPRICGYEVEACCMRISTLLSILSLLRYGLPG